MELGGVLSNISFVNEGKSLIHFFQYKYVEVLVGITLSIGSIISQNLLVNVRMQASNSLELRLEPMSNLDETQPFSRGELEFNAGTQSSTSLNYRATV